MCGIAGIIDFKQRFAINHEVLAQMASPMRFRGPDQEGAFLEIKNQVSIGLVHKRLSIIDLSEDGRQPMKGPDERHIIVFNGEIYNYREVRSMLPASSIFKSESDTEVILHAFLHWGIERCLNLIEGMFAFAIVDTATGNTILARDRFGEKPLYYHQQEGLLAFSSDIRSFDVLPINKSVDLFAVGYYFSEMCTPSTHSIWSEIQKLPAAHYLSFRADKVQIFPYWHLDYRAKVNDTFDTSVTKVGTLLENSVRSRLVADVPVGCFLSGGLDSSLVALFAARHCTGKLNTFSVGFDFDAYNELPFARQVADKIGSNHHEIVLSPQDLNLVGDLLAEYGEPFADSSQIPSHYVSKFASQNVKAAVGGDGGDELFGGYETFAQAYRMQQWYEKRELRPLFGIIHKLTGWKKANYLKGVMSRDITILATALHRSIGFSPTQLSNLCVDSTITNAESLEYQAAIREALQYTEGTFDPLLYSSIRTRLVNDYFVKTDRASMFNSLELRTPFVDRTLVEYVCSLPYTHIRTATVGKLIPKALAAQHFSPEFVNRKKQGFEIPIGKWIRKEWKNDFLAVIAQRQQLVPLNYNYVDALLADHMTGKADHTHRLWIIYVFHKWAWSQRNGNKSGLA